MQRSNKNNDWKKGAWVILWWSGGNGEELGNWTSGGLSMSGDCTAIFIQTASRGFLYYWDYVLGTGSSEVSNVLFCVFYWKKIITWEVSLLAFFPLTLPLQREKYFLLLQNWVHFLLIFLKLFSQLYFFKVRLIDSIVVKISLLFRLLISHAPI